MTASATSRRVLFVSYVFPPVGGGGVQRVTKFVKFLPGFGWHPSVLTPSNPSTRAQDLSLSSDVPGDTLIRRTRTLEPSFMLQNLIMTKGDVHGTRPNRLLGPMKKFARSIVSKLLQPDPQVLWYPGAVREGRRLLRSVPHAAIIVSGPPFSTFLIAAALRRTSGLPLVLDYRDEWDLTNQFQENKRFGPVAQWLNRSLEYRIVRAASLILATSDASMRALEKVRDDAGGKAPVRCLRNGFDPEDFTRATAPADAGPRERYRVVYAGTLWAHTSARPLVDAIDRMCREAPGLGAHLEVVFAGRRTADQDTIIARLNRLPVQVVVHPYLDHTVVVDLMGSADLLCSLTTDEPSAERFLNAKVFEYMASHRPILAIAPPGDLWQVLEDYPDAGRFVPSDVDGIASFLARRVSDFRAGIVVPPVVWDGTRYDRRVQSKALADMLSEFASFQSEVR